MKTTTTTKEQTMRKSLECLMIEYAQKHGLSYEQAVAKIVRYIRERA